MTPGADREYRGGLRVLDETKSTNREIIMLRWSVILFIIAIVAAVFGFAGIAGAAAGIAKILFVVFLVLFLLSLLFGRRAPV